MTCKVCDEREATHTAEQHPHYDAWARWMSRNTLTWPATCDECWTEADNVEPPEPDGECFRGGEAAAFQAEQQAERQRVK